MLSKTLAEVSQLPRGEFPPRRKTLAEILREQEQANDLLLSGGRLVWVLNCSGCGRLKTTESRHGMVAMHELREEGWAVTVVGRALCPSCSEMI